MSLLQQHCLPAWPAALSHTGECSAAETRPQLPQVAQGKAFSSHLWKFWFPWHSLHEKVTVNWSKNRTLSLTILNSEAGSAFPQDGSEGLGKKKFWRCEWLRSATILQLHLTLASGSACLLKVYEMLHFVKSPLRKKMRILLIYLNGTLTGNLITRRANYLQVCQTADVIYSTEWNLNAEVKFNLMWEYLNWNQMKRRKFPVTPDRESWMRSPSLHLSPAAFSSHLRLKK